MPRSLSPAASSDRLSVARCRSRGGERNGESRPIWPRFRSAPCGAKACRECSVHHTKSNTYDASGGALAALSPDRLRTTMAGQTIGESAYGAIRQDIIFGRLAPGQKLKLETLRVRYGVSVSTLREILSRLCSEGFVVAEGQRGFEVEPVSAEGFREVAGM